MTLTYSDVVPSEPGWYWKRSAQGVSIVRLPHLGMVWPTPWLILRAAALDGAADEELRSRLAELPLESWLVEYAGPLEEPA